MFKAYIFDWDGTLINTLGAIRGAVSSTLDTFEFSGDRDDIMDTGGVSLSLREGFPIIFGDKWEQASEHFYKSYGECFDMNTKMSGYDTLMDYLSASKIPCVINSNKLHTLLGQEIVYFDTQSVFSKWVGAGVMKNDKPAPDGALSLISYIKEKFNIDSDICYVGDTAVDIKCGRNIDITTILIGSNLLACAENPDYQYDDLNTFLQAIQS